MGFFIFGEPPKGPLCGFLPSADIEQVVYSLTSTAHPTILSLCAYFYDYITTRFNWIAIRLPLCHTYT
jgi:hypothetical protein